MLDINRLPAVA